jgi:DNA-binding transcriptional ArsR family regulator
VRAINDINDPRLVKALAHPLRVSILSALASRTASPSQLAEELDVPLPNLSYHIRMLVQLDLLKLVRTRPRRGAIEHYYQAKGPVAVTDQAWGEVPELVKEAMISSTLRTVGQQVDAAAKLGGFEDNSSVLARQSLKLDRKAWKELSKKLVELDRYATKLHAESEKRRQDSNHEDEIDAGMVLMLFKGAPIETPEPSADGEHKAAGRSSRSRARQTNRA